MVGTLRVVESEADAKEARAAGVGRSQRKVSVLCNVLEEKADQPLWD